MHIHILLYIQYAVEFRSILAPVYLSATDKFSVVFGGFRCVDHISLYVIYTRTLGSSLKSQINVILSVIPLTDNAIVGS